MKFKKIIVENILRVINLYVQTKDIDPNKITFISLESKVLNNDLKMIREHLPGHYDVTEVLYCFEKNNLFQSFGYMLNMIKQIWHINQSHLVIINDNNFVVSKFKKPGVTVLQVWHANGAIKKFGNCVHREYKIVNYDYVLANSEAWIEPYAQSFGVEQHNIKVTGLPKVDVLSDESMLEEMSAEFYQRYPMYQDKKILLYAPTFRGNIFKGFSVVDLDVEALLNALGEEYLLVYKPHPLVSDREWNSNSKMINMKDEDLYTLFSVSEMLISDYSSIVFDYSLLKKPMVFYAPDLDEYHKGVGYFIGATELPGKLASTPTELVELILSANTQSVEKFSDKYFKYKDGQNITRTMELIEKIMNNSIKNI